MNAPLHAERRTHRSRRSQARRGMVLIMVLLVVAMIALAGYTFAEMMFTERKGVQLHGDGVQRQLVLASAETYLTTLVEQSRIAQEAAGGLVDNPILLRRVSLGGRQDDQSIGMFSVIAGPHPARHGERRFGLSDESSRLNLAAVVAWEKAKPGAGRDALLALPGMTDETAAALLDWMDADDETRPGGAESDYYAELDPPYAPKNAVPETIEELLLVKGVTRWLLFGADANRDGSIDEAEAARVAEMPKGTTGSRQHGDDNEGQQSSAWTDLVTLYSAERNRSAAGSPRIWLNSTDLGKLHSQLSRDVDQELADFIVLYRQFGPAAAGAPAAPGASPTSPGQGGSQPPSNSAGDTAVDLTLPASHTIASPLDLVGASVSVTAEGTTRAVPSPLQSTDTAWKDRFDKLLDVATMLDADVIVGRVNVDLAPLEVLAGVPGMDAALAEQIVERRSQMTRTTSESDAPRQPSWLLYENLVEQAQMRALLPYLTTGGDVFRCQIAGKLTGDRVAERAEVVIDGTRSPAVQLYWRDLRVLGPAFALETLGLADDREASSSDSPPQSTAGAQAPL